MCIRDRGWKKDNVYKVKVNTREALIARIIDAFAQIKNSPAGLRIATRVIHNRAVKCIEVDGHIFENLL